jgi:epoxyqueuosine reductase
MASALTSSSIKELAHGCGFELAGSAVACPSEDFERFQAWRDEGRAGEMTYLTDHRGDLRSDPRNLLPSAQTILCVGKLYNTPHPYSADLSDSDRGWISRYAWGPDYHEVMRRGLESLLERIAALHPEPFEWRICVDTAPLLERSYARAAGLGWIGKNTCLINQQQGSWFFLGELLLSIPLAPDLPAPERCGTCRRCIDACPTQAIVPVGDGHWSLDARLCISYLTIEKRGAIPRELAEKTANRVFGCDICQDVCPWNRRAPVNDDPAFQPSQFAPPLERLAGLTEEGFRSTFRHTAVWRTKYAGFLRNVAIAMGNSGHPERREVLESLTRHPEQSVASAARHALSVFDEHLHYTEKTERIETSESAAEPVVRLLKTTPDWPVAISG